MSDSEKKVLKDLNPVQKEAVCWGKQPLLIVAGAGSGKTRILTHRIAYLIEQGTPSFNILGVTFTNKAAAEMRNRVIRLADQEVWVSTFHATCLRILRLEGAGIGLDRHFSIYDEQDQLTLIKECLKELNMNEKQIHPKGVRERIQRAKDFLITPYQYTEKAADLYEESVSHVYKLYEEKLEKLKACDFGDLIMKCVLLFDRKPEVLNQWQDRFQHILVDEYQDTNHAQYRWIKLLASRRKQITVVGDPDQSIYAWRGADIRNILSFEVDYPQCGIIKMEQNYRSTATILDAANELIKHNQTRKPKELWTENAEGHKVVVYEARDEKEEAFYVAMQIQNALQKGKTLADQVIFYRVHAQSRVLEDVLRRLKMPYKIVGGTRFYDRREIKDLIAYLKVIAWPHDDISLKRIINVPVRGLGKKAVESLEVYAKKSQIPMDQTLKECDKVLDLSPKAKKALADFRALLETLRKMSQTATVGELLQRILERTEYLKVLEAEKTIEAQSRLENIEEFFSVIEDFEDNCASSGESASLEAFLESISLMTDLDQWDNGTNVLTLMTLHTAKGLEFPVVYIVGMEEGLFPNGNAFTEDTKDIEEERRLCYVGMTRARERLTLTYSRERRIYGSKQFNLPSRFLNEIPPEICLFEHGSRPQIRPDDVDDVEIEYDDDAASSRISFDHNELD